MDAATSGLLPAFRDLRDGETHLSRSADGALATIHLFHHLPSDWVIERDPDGEATQLHPAIIAGFHRGPDFYPLQPRLELPLDA